MAGKFTFNTRELGRRANETAVSQKEKALNVLREINKSVVKEAKANAPVDEGNLTQDITGVVYENKKSLSERVYVPGNAPSSEYAVKMHESEYNLGKHSQEKQEKDPSHTIGKKFITRALEAKREKIKDYLIRKLSVK